MMKVFRNPTAQAETEPTAIEAAQAHLADLLTIDGNERATVEAMSIALSATHPDGDLNRLPAVLRDRARPYLNRAARRRPKLRDEIDELLISIELRQPAIAEARAVLDQARRDATNRIAADLQPRQRAAVLRIASALETLSEAVADEQALHLELVARAPLSTSPKLPRLTDELADMCVSNFGGTAAAWGRRIRKLGVI